MATVRSDMPGTYRIGDVPKPAPVKPKAPEPPVVQFPLAHLKGKRR